MRARATPRAVGSTHHPTREVALCVGGTRGDDESEGKHHHKIHGSRREHAQEKSGSGPETWARRTGARWRDCDGKQQPHLTSRAHGARKNGLNQEAEKPRECPDTQHVVGRKQEATERRK